MYPLILDLNSLIDLSEEQFFDLCQRHELIRFERNADRTLSLRPLFGGITSNRSANLCYQLVNWNRDEIGICFSSSTGFTLPNTAVRSPTLSWLKRDKWDALTKEQKEKFAPVCPDFIVEFCTDYDDWRQLQKKMQEYLDNGCQLGWLIDLNDWQVEIYRFGKNIEVLNNPASLSGEDVLPGFILDLAAIM